MGGVVHINTLLSRRSLGTRALTLTTEVRLTATSTPIKAVKIKNHPASANTFLVGVLGSQVWPLAAGQEVELIIDNLDKIYYKLDVAGSATLAYWAYGS